MLKQFFKDSAVYGIAALLVQSFSFFLLPLYTRVLTQTDYGVSDLLGVVNNVASIIVPLSLIAGVERFYTGAQSEEEKVSYASTALWFTMAAYLVFILVGFVLAQPLSIVLLASGERAGVFRWFLLAAWGYGVFNLLQFQLRLMFKSKAYALVSLLSTLSALGVTILLVVVFRLGIIGVVFGWCAQYLVGGVVSYYFARRIYALKFNFRALQEMVKYSLPLVPSGLAVLAIIYVDRIAIRTFMTMDDVGVFAVAYKLVIPIYSINAPIANALNPLIFTRFREPETPREVARIFRYVVAMSILIFAGYSLFAKEVLTVMAPENYSKAAGILPLIALVMILNLMPIFAPGLSIAKKTGILALINGLVALLSTMLNFIMTPRLGLVGSALSNVIGVLALFGLRIYYSQKYYSIPFEWRKIGLALLPATLIIGFGSMINISFWAGLGIKIVLFVLVAGTLLLFRLVEWEKIVEFRFMAKRYLSGLMLKGSQ